MKYNITYIDLECPNSHDNTWFFRDYKYCPYCGEQLKETQKEGFVEAPGHVLSSGLRVSDSPNS